MHTVRISTQISGIAKIRFKVDIESIIVILIDWINNHPRIFTDSFFLSFFRSVTIIAIPPPISSHRFILRVVLYAIHDEIILNRSRRMTSAYICDMLTIQNSETFLLSHFLKVTFLCFSQVESPSPKRDDIHWIGNTSQLVVHIRSGSGPFTVPAENNRMIGFLILSQCLIIVFAIDIHRFGELRFHFSPVAALYKHQCTHYSKYDI